jgi:hypothetical protein
MMTAIGAAGTFQLGDRTVRRMGYGAMKLARPHVFGPPRNKSAALTMLREVVAQGVNHIDTSDFYCPHVTNQLIREALHPFDPDLVIVTKVGALRGADASAVPRPAILADQQGTYVYVVDDKNIARQRRVRVGQSTPETAGIVDGLKEGERVVVEGVRRTRPDSPVAPAAASASRS